ncbi:MAG: hypothetical protein M3R43_04210 [Acidobacteriota bacterium]|nr:hypothetical protein [Acidobacteriota bacterium]
MTQTQMLLTIFIPTLTVLVGILLNRNDYTKLENRLGTMETRLDGRINASETRLDGRMNGLESRFHADMLMVIGKLTELELRVARTESERR